MTNHPPNAATPSRVGGASAVARYELVFEDGLSGDHPRAALFVRLKKLRAVGAATLGEAYARLASSTLELFERLQDRNAERRQRRRSPALLPTTTPRVASLHERAPYAPNRPQ